MFSSLIINFVLFFVFFKFFPRVNKVKISASFHICCESDSFGEIFMLRIKLYQIMFPLLLMIAKQFMFQPAVF